MFTLKAIEESGVPFKDYSCHSSWLRYTNERGREFQLENKGGGFWGLYKYVEDDFGGAFRHVGTKRTKLKPTRRNLKNFHETIFFD